MSHYKITVRRVLEFTATYEVGAETEEQAREAAMKRDAYADLTRDGALSFVHRYVTKVVEE